MSSRSRPISLPAALLGALVLTAAGCQAPVGDGAATNVVRTELTHAPKSLTIVGAGDGISTRIGGLLSDGLVRFERGLVLRPGLAESWQVSEDGRTVTFRLREGVRWHDGEKLTADDVVFTIDKIREPASQARSWAPAFDLLVSVEARDDRTVVARYSEAYADYLEAWLVPIIPEHLAGRDEDFLTGEFSRQPVGCGPFRFVSWEPDLRLELEANPDYWDGRPSIDRLVFRILPDTRTAYQALLKGELDVIAATPDLYREAMETDPPVLGSLLYYRLGLWYVGLNQDGSNPFFGDPRVRRALLLALDRRDLSEQLFDGKAIPAVSTYHPKSVWTDPEIEPWPYDPGSARRLLDEAGWTDGDGDGVRDRDGVVFSFTLLISVSPQEVVDRMAAWIQQSLAEIGLRVEIERIELNAFREKRNRRDYQAMMTGLSFDPNPDQLQIYHSSRTFDNGGFNHTAFADAEVDRLLERGRVTFDERERRAIYHALQRRIHELQPLTPLFHFASPILHDRRLHGIEPSPLDPWRVRPGPAAWHWVVSEED